MTCDDHEKKLPAYLDGELSSRESEELAAHLAVCENCRRSLENLKASHHHVRNLTEVEPPPWLKQKIMNRVREEHERRQKGWCQFFSPLYIKVPVQACAVIVISVLALYVYRQDEPQMRMKGLPLPPSAVFEVEKEQATPQRSSSVSIIKAPLGDAEPKDALRPVLQVNRTGRKDVSTRKESYQKAEEAIQVESKRDFLEGEAETARVLAEKSPSPQRAESARLATGGEKRSAASPPQAVARAASRMCGQDVCVAEQSSSADALGLSVAKGTIMKDSPTILALRLIVKDPATASAELNKYAEKIGARFYEITIQEKQRIFSAEIQSQYIAAFREKLGAIGLLGEDALAAHVKDVTWVKVKVLIVSSPGQNP